MYFQYDGEIIIRSDTFALALPYFCPTRDAFRGDGGRLSYNIC